MKLTWWALLGLAAGLAGCANGPAPAVEPQASPETPPELLEETVTGETVVGVGFPRAGTAVDDTFIMYGHIAGLDVARAGTYAFEASWSGVTPAAWYVAFHGPDGSVAHSFKSDFGETSLAGQFLVSEPGSWTVTVTPEGPTGPMKWAVSVNELRA